MSSRMNRSMPNPPANKEISNITTGSLSCEVQRSTDSSFKVVMRSRRSAACSEVKYFAFWIKNRLSFCESICKCFGFECVAKIGTSNGVCKKSVNVLCGVCATWVFFVLLCGYFFVFVFLFGA